MHSIKNIRKIAKEQTMLKILNATYKQIQQNGIINLKTIDVAKEAGVAHGTLFSHFATKEMLIQQVCTKQLLADAKQLRSLSDNGKGLIVILDNYLDLVIDNELFYEILAKEFPLVNSEIQKALIANETIIKNILIKEIEADGDFCPKDITSAVSFLFGAIQLYLSRKRYMISDGKSILKQKKQIIIQSFIKLIT